MNASQTASPPGVAIEHIPASTGCYVGSPSIVRLSDGSYVASMDIFGPGSSNDTSLVFRSKDSGETWRRSSKIKGAFWSGLFVHRDVLYLLGCDKLYGDLVIRKSDDGGRTWSNPSDGLNGLLRNDKPYHTAPSPVVEHNGGLFRAVEDVHPKIRWGVNFRAMAISADADADLLNAGNWAVSNRLPSDTAWLGGRFGGWLEGNMVVSPEGELVDILRVDYRAGDCEYAAVVRISADGGEASFESADFVQFPGGCKKFTIRRSPSDGMYYSLSNIASPGFEGFDVERVRNTLALIRSADLRRWEVLRVVLHHDQVEDHAFQYVDWRFDGADLALASRTAHADGLGGAHSQHDANFLTFHRITGP